MCPKEYLAVGMYFLNMGERLEEVVVHLLFSQSINLFVGELVVAEKAGDDLLPLSGDVELLLQSLRGGDDVPRGLGAAGQGGGDLVAAAGEGVDLVLELVERELGREGGVEEVLVDGEGPVLDGGLEIPPGPRGVVVVEGREGRQRVLEIGAVGPSLQDLLQLPGESRCQVRHRCQL